MLPTQSKGIVCCSSYMLLQSKKPATVCLTVLAYVQCWLVCTVPSTRYRQEIGDCFRLSSISLLSSVVLVVEFTSVRGTCIRIHLTLTEVLLQTNNYALALRCWHRIRCAGAALALPIEPTLPAFLADIKDIFTLLTVRHVVIFWLGIWKNLLSTAIAEVSHSPGSTYSTVQITASRYALDV